MGSLAEEGSLVCSSKRLCTETPRDRVSLLVLPEVFETVRSQGSVADCMLNAAVTKVSLNCSGVVSVEC